MSRVMLAANSSWNLKNFRESLIRGLAEAGHEVVTVTPDPEGLENVSKHLQCRIDRSGANIATELASLVRVWRTVAAERPDVFLSFTIKPNLYGAIACRLLGIPAVPNVSGLGTAFLGGSVLRSLSAMLYRFAFARVPLVFFQNADDEELFLRAGLVRPGQSEVLPGSGVNLSQFTPSDLPSDLRFLLIARMLGDKGVREFVEAARLVRKTHPGAVFQILGALDPGNRTSIGQAELERWVREGVIQYLGSTADVRPFIDRASAIVLPSYREGLPRTLLEAAAMGRPMIATDVPGCREMAREGLTGFLCRPRDPSSLAAAMQKFASTSYAARVRMGVRARSLVEEGYSEQRVLDAYLRAIEQLDR